jgi:hypothetical protein
MNLESSDLRGGPMSRALTNLVLETSVRVCPHCAAAMTRMDEHTVCEQYTRQTWWTCTECRRSRYYRA